MKKLILGSMLLGSSLFAEVNIPQVLTDNDFETYEFQLFVTNTKNVHITKDMTSKIVFEGDVEDYYKNYNEINEKKFKASEEVSKRLVEVNQQLGNAVYFKDVQSLNNLGVATIGSIALNSVLGSFLGDDTYVQVLDFYEDEKRVTRVIKYLVSDDGLDKDEYQLVFNTTNDENYHFRSGAITRLSTRLF
ncbi:hypothetical protein CRV02_12935 [Arcobacter sp. CECT 8989]|uniref:hypothetical protein n=1 Tax=Arcobacter sp. CECT 8989 TaxID=2044509 RepID=UPI00100B8E55|nr:hypothetical protein [Arcobacter sp. CECT 8989]RXJ98950.1 hypothetical protein CRV02_12935 [Arcobacter sp. CECT 8989]